MYFDVFSNLILQWLQKYEITKAGETRGSRTTLFKIARSLEKVEKIGLGSFYFPGLFYVYVDSKCLLRTISSVDCS